MHPPITTPMITASRRRRVLIIPRRLLRPGMVSITNFVSERALRGNGWVHTYDTGHSGVDSRQRHTLARELSSRFVSLSGR